MEKPSSIKLIDSAKALALTTFTLASLTLPFSQPALAHTGHIRHNEIHTTTERIRKPKYEILQRKVGFTIKMTLNIDGKQVTGPVMFENVPAFFLTQNRKRGGDNITERVFLSIPDKISFPAKISMNGRNIPFNGGHISLVNLLDPITDTQLTQLDDLLVPRKIGDEGVNKFNPFTNFVLDVSGATNLNLTIEGNQLNTKSVQDEKDTALMMLEARANQYIKLLNSGHVLTAEQLSLVNQWELYNSDNKNTKLLDQAYLAKLDRISQLLDETQIEKITGPRR